MEQRVRRWRENRGGVGQDLLAEVNSLGKLPQGVPVLSVLLGSSSSPQTRGWPVSSSISRARDLGTWSHP